MRLQLLKMSPHESGMVIVWSVIFSNETVRLSIQFKVIFLLSGNIIFKAQCIAKFNKLNPFV